MYFGAKLTVKEKIMPQIKRYLLFGGDCHYAKGGMNDLISAFDYRQDAIDFGLWRNSLPRTGSSASRLHLEWYHIYDTVEQKICDWSERLPYGVYEKP